MNPEVERLKIALRTLSKENAEFQIYYKHLRNAITQISEANDKLLFSFHERYTYFVDLEGQLKFIENNIALKRQEIQYLDLANTQFTSNKKIEIPDDLLIPMIRFTENEIQNYADKVCPESGDFESYNQLIEKDKELKLQSSRLKNEFTVLFEKLGHNEKFEEILRLSEKHEKLLKKQKEYHEKYQDKDKNKENNIGDNNINSSEKEKENKSKNKTGSHLHGADNKNKINSSSTEVDSYAESVSSSLLSERLESARNEPAWKNVVCQTNDNMRTREISKKFAKTILEEEVSNQTTKIENKKQKLQNLTDDINKLTNELAECKEKHIEKLSRLSNNSLVESFDICKTTNYVDQETECDEIQNFEDIQIKVEKGYSQTLSNLKVSNEKLQLESIYEQKALECKLAEMSFERKTNEYKSLLRKMKLINPEGFSAKFKNVTKQSPKLEQKKNKYLLKIERITQKTQELNDESIDIEDKVKKLNLRIEILERKLELWKKPRDHTKYKLSNICQEIALNQESIREKMKDIAFYKLETDFVDRVKAMYCKNFAQNNDITQDIKKLQHKLRRLKLRCLYTMNKTVQCVLTSRWEIDDLQKRVSENNKRIKIYEDKIQTVVRHSVPIIQELQKTEVPIPPTLDSCETLNSCLLNVY
ncbi:hypothetical protein TRFO_34036 [Tritrichomonas foetus]|uniref:DUF4201 domain-containing protein n=1 Tax=Tritrichomonas foetus TaxID=1144522 RepID=A0A1J4JK55_9EUKA|nr:hypothetical protein TRFO_34036 [Tritrichomonas foetus]|eukprot:OHS99530.1 hypothetical protein TRFO_34036 [Tritrichomonas foetus]